MRCFALAAALLGGYVSASNLRTNAAPTSAKSTDRDLVKLQTIEHSLQALAKGAHAPIGTDALLKTISQSEHDLQAAGGAKDKRAAVMKRFQGAMTAFQENLVKRQMQLKKDSAADNVKQAEGLKPIAKKLQKRLDTLNALEKDLRKRAKDREDSEAKMKSLKPSKKQSKDDIKTQHLLKYFAKKNKRQLKKKLVQWKAERKALTDAIRFANAGDAQGTREAMKSIIKAEGPAFLY